MKTWEQAKAEMENECKFTIRMVADSTTIVYADIPTRMKPDEAWLLHGMTAKFESRNPAVPLDILNSGAYNVMVLQLHNNTESALLLGVNDDNVLLDIQHEHTLITYGADNWDRTLRATKRIVTAQPTLRAIFRTDKDISEISLDTIQMVGRIGYEVIKLPADPKRTKLGNIDDL